METEILRQNFLLQFYMKKNFHGVSSNNSIAFFI